MNEHKEPLIREDTRSLTNQELDQLKSVFGSSAIEYLQDKAHVVVDSKKTDK